MPRLDGKGPRGHKSTKIHSLKSGHLKLAFITCGKDQSGIFRESELTDHEKGEGGRATFTRTEGTSVHGFYILGVCPF